MLTAQLGIQVHILQGEETESQSSSLLAHGNSAVERQR